MHVRSVDSDERCANAFGHFLQRPARKQAAPARPLVEPLENRASCADLVPDTEPVEHEHGIGPQRDTGADLDTRQIGRALKGHHVDIGAAQGDCRCQATDSGTHHDRTGHLVVICAGRARAQTQRPCALPWLHRSSQASRALMTPARCCMWHRLTPTLAMREYGLVPGTQALLVPRRSATSRDREPSTTTVRL